jgi:hypothetical protein
VGVVKINNKGKKSLGYLTGDFKIDIDKNRNIGSLTSFEKEFGTYLKHKTRKYKKRII